MTEQYKPLVIVAGSGKRVGIWLNPLMRLLLQKKSLD